MRTGQEEFNGEIARALWQAAAESDRDSIRSLLSPDVVFSTLASGDLSGAIRGPDAVLDLLARSGELVEELRSELVDVYTSEEGAVIQYRLQAEREVSSLDTQALLVLRIEDGAVVNACAVPVEMSKSDSFWASH